MALGLIDQPSMLFVFNLNAVLLTLTVLLIPFAVLPIFLSLERIPQALRHASADLGASAPRPSGASPCRSACRASSRRRASSSSWRSATS